MISALLLNAFTVLVYPGVLWTLLLALLAGRVLRGPARGGRAVQGLVDALRGQASLGYAAATILALAALATLPWPNLPWQTRIGVELWLLWALVEASALAAALPGLSSPVPVASRAAVRSMQLGVSGRLVIWIAAGAALNGGGRPGWPAVAALGLAALATLLALPAAAGWPPFAYDPFGSGGLEGTLSDEDAAIAEWARRVQSTFWLALLVTLFVPLPQVAWWVELPMRLGMVLGLASLVRGLRGLFVTRTLPAALRWCWWLALPCALAAVALL